MIKRKVIYKLIFFFLFINSIFSQTWDFHGDILSDPFYVFVFGDKNLFESQNPFYEGLNYQIKGKINLNQIYENLSISLNYTTGYNPQDQIFLSLKSKNLSGTFSNNFQESLSYLTLWNKNINGIKIEYKEKFSLRAFIAKIESTKKQKSFYGNNTSGPYILGDFYLVPLRERVYLNGKLLEKDIDYIIDYTYGILYFVDIISSEDLIIVEYEVRGITPQIYNLLGIKLDFSPFLLSFLNIDDPSSNINRKFIEFSFAKDWKEGNLGFSLSQGILDKNFVGRAYDFNFNYKKDNIKIFGRSLKINEDYPYFKEVMGNFNINPGTFQNSLSFDFNYSFLNYSLNFFRENNQGFIQSFKNNLSLNFPKFSLIGTWNNDIKFSQEKDIKSLKVNYKEIPSSFYIQETREKEKREIVKNLSLTPQTSNLKLNISYQTKDTYSSDLYLLNQNRTNFYIEIFNPNLSISLGETLETNKNFAPELPLEKTEIFITDGYQVDFTLSYTPLPNTLEVYINGIFVENGGTFTYYIPSEEPITYTLEINILDKTLEIFFIDETGKNPPPSGLTIAIKYKYLFPIESYYKKDEISLRLKRDKINFSIKGEIGDKDKNLLRILSLSLYGEIFPKLWTNLSFSQYFDENKKNLSLNISYRPSFSEIYLSYLYQDTPLSIVQNLSITGKLNTLFGTFQGIYSFRDSIYSNYLLRINNFKISWDFKIFDGDTTISYLNEKRESSYPSLYLSSSYSFSYYKKIKETGLKYSLSKEEYSDLSFKIKNTLEIFPFKNNNNTKFFIENIYSQKNEIFYSLWRLGALISLIW